VEVDVGFRTHGAADFFLDHQLVIDEQHAEAIFLFRDGGLV